MSKTQDARSRAENLMMTAELAPDANPVRDKSLVIDLVTRARKGDKQAWDALVERYAPLIWSICRGYRLADADADDVSQSVWLSLVDQLHKVRDPAALPGWPATTTRRACLQVLRAAQGPLGRQELDVEILPDEQAGTAEQEPLVAERHAALREAFLTLPPSGPEGADVFVAPVLSHRLPGLFDAAARYDPDRYLAHPEQAGYLHGFGGGTHRCLGEHFALLLTHVAITRLLRHHDLTLADPHPLPVRTPAFKGPRSPCRIHYRRKALGLLGTVISMV
jgi:RNA polymerase sigma factor (sigma-70 family)